MWRYECDDCNHRSAWMSKADAERVRWDHHDNWHSGKSSAHERIASDNRERLASNPRQIRFIALLFAFCLLCWIIQHI